MIKEIIYVLISHYLLSLVHDSSLETRVVLEEWLFFINIGTTFLFLRTYTKARYGRFISKEYLRLSIHCSLLCLLVYNVILEKEYNIIKLIVAYKPVAINILIFWLSGDVPSSVQKILFTIGTYTTVSYYTGMIQYLDAKATISQIAYIYFRFNIDGYFSKFVLWYLEFIELGRIYIINIIIHFTVNSVLFSIAFIIRKNYQDDEGYISKIAWNLLLFFFLAIYLHGNVITSNRYVAINSSKNNAKINNYTNKRNNGKIKQKKMAKKAVD